MPSPAQTDQPAGLFLISVDSPERKRLTSAPTNTVGDFCPLLSPNGNELIFVRRINYGIGEIYRVLLNGEMQAEREPEIIRHENKAIRDLAWTPDGRGILYSAGYFLANERFLQRIKLADAKSNIGYPAIQESFGEGAYFITTSSKTKRLIYSRWAQDTNILRMELSGNGIGPSEPFIASKRTEYCVDYSPDGRAIAFSFNSVGDRRNMAVQCRRIPSTTIDLHGWATNCQSALVSKWRVDSVRLAQGGIGGCLCDWCRWKRPTMPADLGSGPRGAAKLVARWEMDLLCM